jgi:hypothetical protein
MIKTFLRPGLQHDLDVIFEDLAVHTVVVEIAFQLCRRRETGALGGRIVDRRRR